MENLQTLVNIYNSLMQLKVDGENVLILSGCILSLGDMISKMQEASQSQDDIAKGNDK